MKKNEEHVVKFPFVQVKWADHWIDYGDHDLTTIKGNLSSYDGNYSGYLIAESKQVIAIASNIWEGDDNSSNFSDVMYIMKRAIISRSDK